MRNRIIFIILYLLYLLKTSGDNHAYENIDVSSRDASWRGIFSIGQFSISIATSISFDNKIVFDWCDKGLRRKDRSASR